VVKRAIVAVSGGRTTVIGRVLNVAPVLWDGTTFTLIGNYPIVLWDDVEFKYDGNIDVVAWKGSTEQFNRVDVTP
jgi:hypothetical protein